MWKTQHSVQQWIYLIVSLGWNIGVVALYLLNSGECNIEGVAQRSFVINIYIMFLCQDIAKYIHSLQQDFLNAQHKR